MIVPVSVHSSQYPDRLREELLESFRTRKINHKFHYETRGQAQRWLAVHDRYSPSRNDPASQSAYDAIFATTAKFVETPAVHIIGLGCGGGTKDMQLLEHVRKRGKMLVYSACDSSLPLVLTAQQKALEILDMRHVHDLVADFLKADDLQRIFITQTTGNSTRIINFLGMIPNFEPDEILPRLSSLLRPNDVMVFSANLAPGEDYRAGVEMVAPQYDNPETRAWLMTVLTDHGIAPTDGELEFGIEGSDLLRITANFVFRKARKISIDGEEFDFSVGDSIRVFYSYRHTPTTVREWLAKESIEIIEESLTHEGEEGIFICRKNDHSPAH
jgi:L-histidine Nalpha-methyltransferase